MIRTELEMRVMALEILSAQYRATADTLKLKIAQEALEYWSDQLDHALQVDAEKEFRAELEVVERRLGEHHAKSNE